MSRTTFTATGADGTVYRRTSENRKYTHCVAIHFKSRDYPERPEWNRGPFTKTEWAGARHLAEKNASSWRGKPHVETVEILEASQLT